MKKVVFKGTINGDVFDNVKDYNERMSELINSGKTEISASSTTNVFEEETDVPNVKLFDQEKFIPYFNSESNGHYLDTLVSDDKEKNEKALENAKLMLLDKFKELNRLLTGEEISNEDALDLAQTVKDIRTCIDHDMSDNDEGIKEISDGIKGLQDQLTVLEEAVPVITLFKNYYDSVWNELKKYLLLK